jgi:hypothetical protein
LSKEWEPDDDFLGHDGQDGIDKVDGVLKKYGLSRDKTITSRDFGIDMARYDLRRDMPEGWYSWQLPVYLLNRRVTFFFFQTALPGTVLPSHAHDVAQFRYVISGGLIYTAPAEKGSKADRGIELKSGDWIYTPEGARYTLSVATNPGQIYHGGYCY